MKFNAKIHFDATAKSWVVEPSILPGLKINLDDIGVLMKGVSGDVLVDFESMDKITLIWTQAK
jgi:hypothetical protein